MKKKIKCTFVAGVKKLVVCIVSAGMILSSVTVPNVDAATDITDLKNEVATAEQALEAAKTSQSEAEEKYSQGYLGFIDWMLEQDNLTTTQEYDLNQARTVITEAQEENFSKWYGGDSTGLPADRNNMVCVIGDLYDATSIANIKNSITIMKSVNYLRENDDNYVGTMKRKESHTNFYFEAVAQTGADRGAGLKRHSSLQVSCENLAFGASAPAYAWYSEKSIFNTIKTSLGITSLTSEADVSDIENEASSQGKTIGHYTNLFWSIDQIMGAGYTDYNGTSCYNASNLSNYSSKYAYYTIDEFESLFNQYYVTIDPDIWQEKVDDAQTKLDNLLEQYYDTCSEHTYGDVTHVEATCTDEGYDAYVCSKCGYTKKENVVEALGHSLTDGVCDRCGITTVKKVNSVTLSYTDGSSTYSNSTYNQIYEVGQELSLKISFTSASKYSGNDVFVIDIKDPSIIGYEASTNSTGIMTMLSIGETTFDVYPKDNPSLIKTYTINVTDAGGHDFTIAEAKKGAAETTETCSKCGQTKTITVPTSVTGTVWYKGNSGTYEPVRYEVGDEVTLRIYYSPTSVDNNEFTVKISDTSVAEYTRTGAYTGTITMLKSGSVTVTIYPTYNPAVKQVYNLKVGEVDDETDSTTENTTTSCSHDTLIKLSRIEPTCTTDGKTEGYYCSDCGKIITEQKTISATGHSWGKAVVTKKATATKRGVITYTCKNDKTHTKTEYTAANGLPKKGKIIKDTKSNGKYKVTSSTSALKTVTYVCPVNKTKKTVNIPATIKYDGVTYKVTAIAKNALKGNKKVTKVVIGKNVKTIGTNAFYGCKKLKTITVASKKITSNTVSANAFKGIPKTTKIKVPKTKIKEYKKIFGKKGLSTKISVS